MQRSMRKKLAAQRRQKMSPEKTDKTRFQELLKATMDANKRGLNAHLICQAFASIWIPQDPSEQYVLNRMTGAIALLKDIKPANKIEDMLATQMVATHSAAMECLWRAMLPNQTFEGREQNLKHAAKLLSIYAGQRDALNKSRGNGQQKVTVKHIHVEVGAQAVVGNVHARSDSVMPAKKPTNAIAHATGEVIILNVAKRPSCCTSQKAK
jgi:hypothetical protein